MPSPSPSVLPIGELREAVRSRVAESSLRAVATEIGMSWKGIDKFLAGSSPHRPTVRKLTQWYLRRTAVAGDPASPETVSAALHVLVEHLPPGLRASTAAAVVELVRRAGEPQGVPPPPWMADT